MGNLTVPELLAPAGSMESLEAAIEAGADAVYLGGASYSARANARNFGRGEMGEALGLCARYGVKSHVAMNTLVFDRELKAWLDEAAFLRERGADALIVADPGAAALLRRYIPDFPLHASTQAGIHSVGGALLAKSLGFSRAVLSRELAAADIKKITAEGGIETEIFIHGALCVSVSGQCLFSAMAGGRSGNRGECAQPCRLPYNGAYPLSLKDCCLACHVREILSLGVRSLKIEGRMKGPEYVYGVVRMWRDLLDGGRNATPGEIKELEALFSRSGTTDGYFTGKITAMSGVRTEADKEKTASGQRFGGLVKKPPFPAPRAVLPPADIPNEAQIRAAALPEGLPRDKLLSRYRLKSASFRSLLQLKQYLRAADKPFFDLIFLPAGEFTQDCGANGVEIPFHCPPGEEEALVKTLTDARGAGAKYALCGSPGIAGLLAALGFSLFGDFRLNITNTASASLMQSLGFERVTLSPELTAARMRDIPVPRSAVVYGRIPLMLLRRCVRKNLIGCKACASAPDRPAWLCDRRGYRFPVLRTGSCMNMVYNSVPHWMGDRKRTLEEAGLGGEHFIFSTETGAECAKVTRDWAAGAHRDGPVKRISVK